MVAKKISALNSGGTLAATDDIPINRGGTTYRVTAGAVAAIPRDCAFWLIANDNRFQTPATLCTFNGTKVSAVADITGGGLTIANATAAQQPRLTRSDNLEGLIPNSRDLSANVCNSGSFSTRVHTDELGTPNSVQKFVEAAASAPHFFYSLANYTIVDGAATKISVVAKLGERDRLFVRLADGAVSDYGWCVFDLTGGTVLGSGVVGTASALATAITAVGNGYYRCDLTVTLGSGDVVASAIIGPTTGTNATITYVGDGTSGLYVAKVQVYPATADTACLDTDANPEYRGIGVSPSIRPGFRFDGAATRLITTDAAAIQSVWGGTNGGYMCAVARVSTIAADQVIASKSWQVRFEVSSGFKLAFYQPRATTAGHWRTVGTFAVNTVYVIEVIYDQSLTTNTPIIIVNGVIQELAVVATPVGAVTADSGIDLRVGSSATPDKFFYGVIGEVMLFKNAPHSTLRSATRRAKALAYGVTLSA